MLNTIVVITRECPIGAEGVHVKNEIGLVTEHDGFTDMYTVATGNYLSGYWFDEKDLRPATEAEIACKLKEMLRK